MEKDTDILNERQKIISALTSARMEKGISQQALADAVGTQKSNICRIESGGQNISLDMLLKITNALGLDVNMILEERKTEPDYPITEYSLRLYDEELLTFTLAEEGLAGLQAKITSLNEARKDVFPLDLKLTGDGIVKWLSARVIPKNRAFVDEILKSLGLSFNDTKGIIDVCKGLSLNDSYWVVPKDFEGTFREYNLYENRFSAALSLVAYTGVGQSQEAFTTSPELTTQGMLRKGWRFIENDGIYLYKGGGKGEGLEPYSEFHASQVAAALGFKHVEYELAKYKGRLCSKCRLFTSDRYGYLPASKLPDRDVILRDDRFLSTFVFDALIFNVDRHLGNFGYMIDNDTNEIVDVAPIFDNGYGLMPHLDISTRSADNDYYAVRNYLRDKHPALFRGWFDFPYELTDDVLERIEGLRKFRLKKHRHYNLPNERIRVLSGFLQKRASDICSYKKKTDKKCEQSLALESLNSNENVGVKSSDKSGLNASEQKAATLILRNSFITESEIANQLEMTIRQVERVMASLKRKAGLKRRGSDKVGEWYFEYC